MNDEERENCTKDATDLLHSMLKKHKNNPILAIRHVMLQCVVLLFSMATMHEDRNKFNTVRAAILKDVRATIENTKKAVIQQETLT